MTGKTVLPGFIDGHGHLEDFHGELYLHLGITTCRADRALSGRSLEPRAEGGHRTRQNPRAAHLDGGRGIGGPLDEHDAFGSRTHRGNIIVTNDR